MNKHKFSSGFSSHLHFLSKPRIFKIIFMSNDQPVYAAPSGILWKWALGKKFRLRFFGVPPVVCVERLLVFLSRDGICFCFCETPKCGFKIVTQQRIVCYIFLVPEYNNISRPFAGHDKL